MGVRNRSDRQTAGVGKAIDFFVAPAAAFRVLYILLASVPMIVDVAQSQGVSSIIQPDGSDREQHEEHSGQ